MAKTCVKSSGHHFEADKETGNIMSCKNCPRVEKYDPLTKTWTVVVE